MMIRNLLITSTIAVALSLGACTSFQNRDKIETLEQRVFALQTDYSGLLSAALSYESLPRCKNVEDSQKACSKTEVVDAIRKADNHAYTSIQAARELVREGDVKPDTMQSAVDSAKSAVDTFDELLTERGVW